MKKGCIIKLKNRVLRGISVVIILTGVTFLWDVSTTSVEVDSVRMESVNNNDSWGNDFLQTLNTKVKNFSPIAIANACGLGSSKCFRCHNGKRALSPKENPETSPWHIQHKKVNHTCTGCHVGNPRMMNKRFAHVRLVVDPRAKPDKTCFSCHHDANKNDLVNTYKAIKKDK